jgi:hypothetical protein
MSRRQPGRMILCLTQWLGNGWPPGRLQMRSVWTTWKRPGFSTAIISGCTKSRAKKMRADARSMKPLSL